MNRLKNMQQAFVCLLLFMAFSTQIEAKVKPANIFASNMVLQQQMQALPLWGTASANKQVVIKTSWDNRTYNARTDQQGRWRVTIATPKAGGPYTITLNDGEVTTLNNILIGEVWVCSGQSNMEMPMKGFPAQPLQKGSDIDILGSTNDALRLFTIEKNAVTEPQNDVKGNWSVAAPASVSDFSATAYYFGSQLQKVLNIPVGLINTCWGGSSVEAWMSREMLAQYPDITIPTSLEGVKQKNQAPTLLYNGMLHPIKGLGIKGFIWYQGESNIARTSQYASLFETYITSLRKEWNMGQFPFYYCQIAPYFHYNQNSAFLREAQLQVESRVPNTAMAVLLDAGEKGCIHPQWKKTAGQRLAQQALMNTYKIGGMPGYSPVYKEMKIQNDTLVLNFDRAPRGLTAYYKPLTLFTVAGEDQKFYPAKAWIKADKVYVTSPSVKKPIAARYAFDNFVEGELFGAEGMPVSSFRTDQFDDVSLRKQ